MTEMTLKGRRIPLLYTTYEMKLIQEEICPLGDFEYRLLGRNREDEEDTTLFGGVAQLDALAGAIRILGNAGLEAEGKDPELTDKWILRALRPAEMVDAVKTVLEELRKGNASEIPEEPKEQQGPVDVTLEEIKKNGMTEN